MDKASLWLANALKMKLMEQVLGPETPPVGRVRNLFITHILIKIPKEQSLKSNKEFYYFNAKEF